MAFIKLLLGSFLLLPQISFGQKNITGTEYTHFQLTLKKDTIDFVVADTNLSQRKPVLLFCQGSQPIPLFFDFNEQGIVPVTLSNFDISSLNVNYHVVAISMPHTPLIVGSDHLNQQYNYITDTTNQYSYSEAYLRADYFENYVNRANTVLKFLMKQKWVNSDKIVVAGHSQGARVAVGIAASNKKVTQLGLFGYNPMGRMDQAIRQSRKDAEAGLISWKASDSLNLLQYAFYSIIQQEDTIATHPSLVAWKSFSKGTLDVLPTINIPIYIAYGSDDIVADFCDLLPLYFIEEEKTNYVIKRYPRLEHNFFPRRENGQIDYTKGKWNDVLTEFLAWTNEN